MSVSVYTAVNQWFNGCHFGTASARFASRCASGVPQSVSRARQQTFGGITKAWQWGGYKALAMVLQRLGNEAIKPW